MGERGEQFEVGIGKGVDLSIRHVKHADQAARPLDDCLEYGLDVELRGELGGRLEDGRELLIVAPPREDRIPHRALEHSSALKTSKEPRGGKVTALTSDCSSSAVVCSSGRSRDVKGALIDRPAQLSRKGHSRCGYFGCYMGGRVCGTSSTSS